MVLASSYCGLSWIRLAITDCHLLIEDRWTWIIIEAWHYDKRPLSDTWNLYMLEPSCVLLWWYMSRGIVLQSALHLMHTACFQFPSCFHKVPIKHGTKKTRTLGVQFLLSLAWKKHCRGLRGCGVILQKQPTSTTYMVIANCTSIQFSKMNLQMPSLSFSCMCCKCAVA